MILMSIIDRALTHVQPFQSISRLLLYLLLTMTPQLSGDIIIILTLVNIILTIKVTLQMWRVSAEMISPG